MNAFFVWLDGLTPLAFVLFLLGFWFVILAALHWLWRDAVQTERDANDMLEVAVRSHGVDIRLFPNEAGRDGARDGSLAS
jgi:hypothetical protein